MAQNALHIYMYISACVRVLARFKSLSLSLSYKQRYRASAVISPFQHVSPGDASMRFEEERDCSEVALSHTERESERESLLFRGFEERSVVW